MAECARAVATARFCQRHLPVNNDGRAALNGRHDHVHTLRGPVKRSAVGKVAVDDLGAAREQWL